jgi:hypothetical protein
MIWSLGLIEHGVPKSQYTVTVQRKCTKTSLVLTFSELLTLLLGLLGR